MPGERKVTMSASTTPTKWTPWPPCLARWLPCIIRKYSCVKIVTRCLITPPPPPLYPTPFLPFLSHDHLLVPLECHLPYLTINCNHPRQLLTSLVLPSASYPLLTPHYHMLLFIIHYSLFTTPYSLL